MNLNLRPKGRGGAVRSGSSFTDSQVVQSWSSQSPLFLGSYKNMDVYERKKNLQIEENLIKICVGDF